MNNNEMIFCPRCGEKMHRSQRNCLKCGQLNYENPANDYMKKYESKQGITKADSTYIIGKGTVRRNGKLSIFNNSRPNEVLANNAGNLTVCILVNIIVYIVGIVISFLGILSVKYNIITAMLSYSFISFLFIFSLLFISAYSLELLFMKADKHWWKALIPIYNLYILCEIVMSNGLLFILFFIPIVDVIMYFILFYNIGRVYGKNPWITLLLGPLMLPFLAFSNTTSYRGVVYVNRTKGQSPAEILYKWNKIVLTLFCLFMMIGFCLFIYNKREWFLHKYRQIVTMSFIKDAQLIIKDAEESIKNDDYICSNGLPIEDQMEYYIRFNNAGEYFSSSKVSTSSLSDMYYRGYVKVVNHNGIMNYYISIDDTVYGINEISSSELKNTYASLNVSAILPEDVIICNK